MNFSPHRSPPQFGPTYLQGSAINCREVVDDDDGVVDATAGFVEGASDTETDDDATTQDNRCRSPHLLLHLAVFVTSRRA